MRTLHLTTAFRHLPLTGLAVSALVAAGGQAAAQQADRGTPTRLETLEVQAESDDILVQDGYVARSGRIGTKMDTPIVDVPQSISTITEKQFEDQKPRSLNEALDYTASANVGAYGFDPRFDAFTIRGFPLTYNGIFRDGLRQYASPTGLFFTEIYGLEGISMASEARPAAIVLDLLMPGLNGFEVIDRLSANENLADVPLMSAARAAGRR